MCGYRREEPPEPSNTENSVDWLKWKEQPRNEKEQFTLPDKSAGNPMDLDLSIISEDDDFQCYNAAKGKPVYTNTEDDLQLLLLKTTTEAR